MWPMIYSTVPRNIINLSDLYAFKKALKHVIINSKYAIYAVYYSILLSNSYIIGTLKRNYSS